MKEEKDNIKTKLGLTIALIVVSLFLAVGGVYAYFAATVSQDTTSRIYLGAVSGLAINFSHGAEIVPEGAIVPGQSWTKTFSATLTNNETNVKVLYSVYLRVDNNTFDDTTGYLTYALDGYRTIAETPITISSGNIPLAEGVAIKGDSTTSEVTQSYTLTLSYPNLTTLQSQGGKFSGYVYFVPTDNEIEYHEDPIKYTSSSTGKATTKENLQVGDIVQIGTERFYVISNNSGSIAALAEWNLLVGCNWYLGSGTTTINSTTEGYGMQNSTAIGSPPDYGNPRIGTTSFGNNNQYTGSYLEGYVTTYVNSIIKPIAGEEITGRLITLEELITLGCDENNLSCLSAPSWVYQTSYWTGSNPTPPSGRQPKPTWFDNYMCVFTAGSLQKNYYDLTDIFGVRPVVEF